MTSFSHISANVLSLELFTSTVVVIFTIEVILGSAAHAYGGECHTRRLFCQSTKSTTGTANEQKCSDIVHSTPDNS